MKKLIIGIALFTVSIPPSIAQSIRNVQNNSNAWFMYFGDHKFSEKWGVHIEAQFRRNDYFLKPQQLLLRTGINYHFAANAFLTAGYCYVQTYPYGVFPVKTSFPESRTWEQFQGKNQIGRIEMVSRLRLEQRWSKLPVANSAGEYVVGDDVYTNRARVLSRFSVPLRGKAIEDKSIYLSCYEEIFINFGKNVGYNVFDQNRAYIALGYKIPKVGRLEMGYMNQLILKTDGIKTESNQTIQVGLSSNIDFQRKRNEKK